jgi:hypothetical protein
VRVRVRVHACVRVVVFMGVVVGAGHDRIVFVLTTTRLIGACQQNTKKVVMLNATFKPCFSYIVAVSFIGECNWNARRKTINLSQVTDKLHHIMLFRAYIV